MKIRFDPSDRRRLVAKRGRNAPSLITAWIAQFVFVACATVSPGDPSQSESDSACRVVGDREKPTAIERDSPAYPLQALRYSAEGIVLVSYRVLADGSTDDVFVVHSIGHASFHKPSVRAVKDWRFEPACEDGVAVDSRRFRVAIPYRMSRQAVTGARPSFKERLLAAREALAVRDFARAQSEIRALDDMEWLTLYELTHRSLVAGILAYKQGRYQEASRFVESVVIFGGKYIGGKGHLDALAWSSRIAFERREYGDVMASLRLLDEIGEGFFPADLIEIERKVEEIRYGDEVLRDTRTIAMPSVIFPDTSWQYTPLRRRLQVVTNSGAALTQLDLECDSHEASFDSLAISSLGAIELLENWGACRIRVYAPSGTEVSVIEPPY